MDKLVLYLIVAIAGGIGSAMQNIMNPPRPDPFTGSQGRALEGRINDIRNDVSTIKANQDLLMRWYYHEIQKGHYDPRNDHR